MFFSYLLSEIVCGGGVIFHISPPLLAVCGGGGGRGGGNIPNSASKKSHVFLTLPSRFLLRRNTFVSWGGGEGGWKE